jgi:hypothetical protein
LTDNGEPTERGPAKASTFRPLYGGTTGTPAQMSYFREFFDKYQGVFQWHIELQDQAIRTERVVTATGRQFEFPAYTAPGMVQLVLRHRSLTILSSP